MNDFLVFLAYYHILIGAQEFGNDLQINCFFYLNINISIKAIQENKTKTIGSGSSKPQTDISDCRGIKTSKAVIACLQPDRRVDVDLKGSEHINK